MARKHTLLAKSRLLQYKEISSSKIPVGSTVYNVSSFPENVDLAKEFIFVTSTNKYYRITGKEPVQYSSGTAEYGILIGEPAVNVASGYESIFVHTYSPSESSTTNNGLSVYKPITDTIILNTGSMYTPTAQAVNDFVVPSYDATYTTATPSITIAENTVYRCTNASVTSLTLNISNMVTGPKTRESLVYFHTSDIQKPTLTITGNDSSTMYFGDTVLDNDKDYVISVKNNSVSINQYYSTVADSGSYSDLTDKPSLETTSSVALSINANEIINGKISLHKVAKTGTYSDLIGKPTIPSAPGTLDTTSEVSLETSANEDLSGNIKLHEVSKTGDYNDLSHKLEAGDNILIRNTHLPLGYEELEYISNGSSTRVNTGVIPSVDNIKVELVVQPTLGVWRIFQSAGTSTNTCGFTGGTSDYSIIWQYRGNTVVTSSMQRNTEHYMLIRATAADGSVELYVKDLYNGEESTNTGTYTYGSIGYPTQFSLFGNAAGLYASSGNRIASLKFWVDNELQIDYVPCRRIQDNIVGFYNKVTGNLITENTGTINAGILAKNNVINVTGLAEVATSGDYNNLTNKPTIPTVPSNVSAFTNDAGYITNSDLPTIDTELSETSANPVQNKAVGTELRKLWENVDVVSRLDDSYEQHNGYISSSTGSWSSSTTYKHWVVPVDKMRKVVITANSNTDAYYTFFAAYTESSSVPTTTYATGYSNVVKVDAGTSVSVVVPCDANYMYLNTGISGAAKAENIVLTGIGVTEHCGTSSQAVRADGTVANVVTVYSGSSAPSSSLGSNGDIYIQTTA